MLYFNPLPRLISLLFAAVIFTAITTAQTILPSTASASFPACALSCPLLILAQDNCIPPTVPVTDQYFYDLCFCQLPILSQLHISPNGTCDTKCPVQSDRQLLESWYNSFCAIQTASTAPTLSATSSAMPMLTTTFTPPSPCLSTYYFDAIGAAVLGPESGYASCFPSGWAQGSSNYFSPGICPSGYVTACSSFNTQASGLETVITCCPR
jgi:hypothetical protein